MLDKIKAIVNSWWFEMATTGAAGIALLVYGHKMYAGSSRKSTCIQI